MAVTMRAFLPLVSANRCRSGRQFWKRRASLDAASQDDAAVRGSVMSAWPTALSGAGQKLQDCRRDTCCPQSLSDLPTGQHRFGSRFEVTTLPAIRAASTPPRGWTAGSSREASPPPPPAASSHGRPLPPPRSRAWACIWAEVNSFGDLGVSLGDGLRTVEQHAANEVSATACQLRGDFQQHGLTHGYRAGPTSAAPLWPRPVPDPRAQGRRGHSGRPPGVAGRDQYPRPAVDCERTRRLSAVGWVPVTSPASVLSPALIQA